MNRVCPSCAAPVSATANFCRSCGCSLSSARLAETTSVTEEELAGEGQRPDAEGSTIVSSTPTPVSEPASAPAVNPNVPDPGNSPDGPLSCTVCGATTEGNSALCPQCAQLIDSTETNE